MRRSCDRSLDAVGDFEFEGTATDDLRIVSVSVAEESNLRVTSVSGLGTTEATFTVEPDDPNLPASGIVTATDTEELVCAFSALDPTPTPVLEPPEVLLLVAGAALLSVLYRRRAR